MLGKIIIAIAPAVVAGVRIVATDPAMRNFVRDLFNGDTPNVAARRPPSRPHQEAQSFMPCPSCMGKGIVPVLAAPEMTMTDDQVRELIRSIRAEAN